MSPVSRRKFIATSLATTVAAGALTSQPARLFARNANQKVSLGFISCGGRARDLMEQFQQTEMADIVAICDPDLHRHEEASGRSFDRCGRHRDLQSLALLGRDLGNGSW